MTRKLRSRIIVDALSLEDLFLSRLINSQSDHTGLWDLPDIAAAIDQWVARAAAKPLVARAALAALMHVNKPRVVTNLFRLLRRCLQVGLSDLPLQLPCCSPARRHA